MNGTIFSSESSLFSNEQLEDTDLNLISLLSIMANMLFFLLVSFGIAVIGLIAANVPTQTEANTIFNVKKTEVTATVAIDQKGFSVTAQNEMLSVAEMEAMRRSFPKVGGEYDYASLEAYTYELKQKFKDSKTVVLTPEPDIKYEILVRVMDATREKFIEVEGKKLRYPLFPSAVVSVVYK